jgi:hypothetical protein
VDIAEAAEVASAVDLVETAEIVVEDSAVAVEADSVAAVEVAEADTEETIKITKAETKEVIKQEINIFSSSPKQTKKKTSIILLQNSRT